MPAALTHCCHQKLLLAVLEMTGSWHLWGVSWRREEEALLLVFLPYLSKILLPSLVKAPNRAIIPQPHEIHGHAGTGRMLGLSDWGRGGVE